MTLRTTAVLFASLLAAPAAQAQGVNTKLMDTSVAPCEDFFRYANGAWEDTASIPAAYSSVGAGREMVDRNQEALRRVLEKVGANAATEKNPSLAKVGHLYAVLMDSARAEREGIGPLRADLERIDAIKTRADLVREIGWFASLGFAAPLRFGPEPDRRNSTHMIGQLYQAGLGLPDRDYYLKTDARSDSTRLEYVAIMKQTFELAGATPAQAAAETKGVMALETALADSSMTRVARRNPHAVFNKMTIGDLAKSAPGIDWAAYFREAGAAALASPDESLDVSMPIFTRQAAALVQGTPIETWRAYLKWNLLRNASPWLDRAFFEQSLRMQKLLTGTTEALPRWKRAAQTVDATTLGEALGQAYVATEFPPSSKARVQAMVDNLRAAFRKRIESRPWMSPATKQQAMTKLDAIVQKIGYPDRWRDFAALQIDPQESGVENLKRTQRFETRRQLAMIDQPVDRTEWRMTPPTVNAYYSPPMNEIVFPAGILQPPQFDPKADDAANYGAIGMVIGHELTHGFDDQGRKFDARGNLVDWWTAEDAKHFEGEAQKVVDQYGAYVGVDTMRINGRLTLGENIADIGGLTLAFDAWKLSLKGKPAPVIGGFTGEQRFFLSYAQAWRRKVRPEQLRTMILTDPHSPAKWRVIGALSDNPEFAKAFGCKSGQPMAPAARPQIW